MGETTEAVSQITDSEGPIHQKEESFETEWLNRAKRPTATAHSGPTTINSQQQLSPVRSLTINIHKSYTIALNKSSTTGVCKIM